MPSRVNGISNLRIKLAFEFRPCAKVRLVHRKPSLSASATLSTICSAVEKRRSIIDLPYNCQAKRITLFKMYLTYLHLTVSRPIMYHRWMHLKMDAFKEGDSLHAAP